MSEALLSAAATSLNSDSSTSYGIFNIHFTQSSSKVVGSDSKWKSMVLLHVMPFTGSTYFCVSGLFIDNASYSTPWHVFINRSATKGVHINAGMIALLTNMTISFAQASTITLSASTSGFTIGASNINAFSVYVSGLLLSEEITEVTS